MDTPITISSSTSQASKTPEKASATNSGPSSKSARWENSGKIYEVESNCTSDTLQNLYDRDSNSTPSVLHKVKTWINSLTKSNLNNGDCSLDNADTDFYGFDNSKSRDKRFLNEVVTTEFPQDEKIIEDELKQYCNSNDPPYAKPQSLGSTSINSRKHIHPKSSKRRGGNEPKMSSDRSNGSDLNPVALSPESEKKKELCSYLQLMKPTDKKIVITLQNRRSVRVKNLNILQEKRELEKKLRQEQSEGSNNDCTLETKLIMDNQLDEEEKEVEVDNEGKFEFPLPRDELLREDVDFDGAIEEEWFKQWTLWKAQNNQEKHLRAETVHNMQNCGKRRLMRLKKEKTIKKSKIVSPEAQNTSQTNGVENDMEKPTTERFFFPKPPPCIATTVRDFSDVIQEDRSTTAQQVKPTKVLKSEKNVHDETQPKVFAMKMSIPLTHFGDNFFKEKLQPKLSTIDHTRSEVKKSDPLISNIIDFGNTIKNDSLGALVDGSLTSPIKTKLNYKKKSKIKPNKFRSSFKIKLVPKKKGSALSNKISKIGNSSNGDIWLDNPEAVSGKKIPRKENVKGRTDHKKEEDAVPKSPLKDTNKSNITQPAELNSTVKSPLRVANKSTINELSPSIMKVVKDPEILPIAKTKDDTPKSSPKRKLPLKPERYKKLTDKRSKTRSTVRITVKGAVKSKQKAKLRNVDVGKKSRLPATSKISTTAQKYFPSTKDLSASPSATKNIPESIKSLPATTKSPTSSKSLATRRTSPSAGAQSSSVGSSKGKRKLSSLMEPGHSDIVTSPVALELNCDKTPGVSKQLIFSFEDQKSSKQIECDLSQRKDPPPSTILAVFKYDETPVSRVPFQPSPDKPDFFSQILNIEKSSDDETPSSESEEVACGGPLANCVSDKAAPFISFIKDRPVNTLNSCLNAGKQKTDKSSPDFGQSSPGNWVMGSPSSRQKKDQHLIFISKEHGELLKVFYVEFNLVICQEHLVSFWTQTALGHVLGAQNMWINKGSVQRLSMNNKCVFKESLEMVVSSEASVAYIELWTKEHQSDIREGPVADIFAIVYFWKKGSAGLDKKVLQLENIKGFADDVQYSVLKSTSKIIVSWHLTSIGVESKKTFVHCYQLAADFQSVSNIKEFETVQHYVSSLHNIEGCDSLIMGCGENKITLWNVERGYMAATIEMLNIKEPLSTLWVKCDRGFLFTLQQCLDGELRLMAIHGMNHSWKKLACYEAPEEFVRLKGVCVDNGIVVACYDRGIVCWNALTSETILETSHHDTEYISGKYIISVQNDQVTLKHAVTYLLSAEDLQGD